MAARDRDDQARREDTSASAMPAATTEGPPVPEAARSLNALMMPTTVPNKPMNGEMLPSVPRIAVKRSKFHAPPGASSSMRLLQVLARAARVHQAVTHDLSDRRRLLLAPGDLAASVLPPPAACAPRRARSSDLPDAPRKYHQRSSANVSASTDRNSMMTRVKLQWRNNWRMLVSPMGSVVLLGSSCRAVPARPWPSSRRSGLPRPPAGRLIPTASPACRRCPARPIRPRREWGRRQLWAWRCPPSAQGGRAAPSPPSRYRLARTARGPRTRPRPRPDRWFFRTVAELDQRLQAVRRVRGLHRAHFFPNRHGLVGVVRREADLALGCIIRFH